MCSDLVSNFDQWREAFIPLAQETLLDSQLTGLLESVRFDDDVWNKANNQPEGILALEKYFNILVSDQQFSIGAEKLHTEAKAFNTIRNYGLSVDPEVLTAIWGIETQYGKIRGDHYVLDALASLASIKNSRQDFFEQNLLSALKIIHSDVVRPDQFKGSWAGAMGHTQFMPTTYLEFGLDIRNRKKIDIWEDDPLDALASTANYLSKHNWKDNVPILSEILLPEGFDFLRANSGREETVAFWMSQGIEFVFEEVSLDLVTKIITPAGKDGPKFALFGNFNTILDYNPSRFYALAVGHLTNLLSGRRKLVSGWPFIDDYLNHSELKMVQERMVRKGYDTGGIDGLIGPKTIQSIQHYQKSRGLIPDGFPDRELFDAVISG